MAKLLIVGSRVEFMRVCTELRLHPVNGPIRHVHDLGDAMGANAPYRILLMMFDGQAEAVRYLEQRGNRRIDTDKEMMEALGLTRRCYVLGCRDNATKVAQFTSAAPRQWCQKHYEEMSKILGKKSPA